MSLHSVRIGIKSDEATTHPNALINNVAVFEEVIGSMYPNANDGSYSREVQPGEVSIGQRDVITKCSRCICEGELSLKPSNMITDVIHKHRKPTSDDPIDNRLGDEFRV